MKNKIFIENLEVYILQVPEDKRPYWVSHFKVPQANEILIKIKTNYGHEGFGMATSYTDIKPIIEPFKNGIAEEIIGEDPFSPEILYNKIFKLTDTKKSNEKKWSRESIIRISSALDIACWDLIGKKSKLPLYKLFGGFRNQVPCYVTCAYYRDGKDNKELKDEIHKLLDDGHKGFKGKVGGLSLKEDIIRMEIIRDIIGKDKDFMIDVNRAWDLKTAIEAAKAFEPLKPTWLEEPIRWEDDKRGLRELSKRTTIPLSGGESELTSFGCRSLLEENAIQILQFDCTMFGGFTHGKKLASICELNHIDVAPHHDCYIHASLVASTPAGRILESFPDPERDPLQAELFENPHKIKDGVMYLNDQPGLGLKLSDVALKKFAKPVYNTH
ncbi:MAG: mandelate racemase [Candidatus Pelagibacter sp.]|nr:mandelate racemase [Candidatus Pelagibacter sp.]|tara:strand:- start:7081 stop:8235 length:1155 start_codon:yes stop_codon:yes gene_type:complete